MIVCGIDPGKKGGIVTICGNNILSMNQIPLSDGDIDLQGILDIIHSIDYDLVVLEEVIGRGGWSANSNFAFGYNVGYLTGALLCNGTMPSRVRPPARQKIVRNSEDLVYKNPSGKRRKKDTKRTSINAANRIFGVDDMFRRTTERQRTAQDGLTDAALIAYYLYLTYNNNEQ